jgi:hypothetical protein
MKSRMGDAMGDEICPLSPRGAGGVQPWRGARPTGGRARFHDAPPLDGVALIVAIAPAEAVAYGALWPVHCKTPR